MDTKRFSSWGLIGMMVAFVFGATIVAGVCALIVKAAVPSLRPEITTFIVYTLQFSLAIVAGALWLRPRGGAGLRFGVKLSDATMVLVGVVVITAAGIVIEPLIALFPAHYLEQLNAAIGRGGWAIVLTVVAAPVLEELFFRGLVLEHISRRWNVSAAVLVSVLLFGVMHFPILPQMVNAFVMAVVMGYIYVLTRSLVPVIAIHAINNGIAYLLLETTGTQTTDMRQLVGNDTVYFTVYSASTLILVGAIFLMARKANTKTAEIALQKETTDDAE